MGLSGSLNYTAGMRLRIFFFELMLAGDGYGDVYEPVGSGFSKIVFRLIDLRSCKFRFFWWCNFQLLLIFWKLFVKIKQGKLRV